MKTTYKNRPTDQKGYPGHHGCLRASRMPTILWAQGYATVYSKGSLPLVGLHHTECPTNERGTTPVEILHHQKPLIGQHSLSAQREGNHAVMMLLHEHAIIWQRSLTARPTGGNYGGRPAAPPNSPEYGNSPWLPRKTWMVYSNPVTFFLRNFYSILYDRFCCLPSGKPKLF
jgi:hypothetical protein